MSSALSQLGHSYYTVFSGVKINVAHLARIPITLVLFDKKSPASSLQVQRDSNARPIQRERVDSSKCGHKKANSGNVIFSCELECKLYENNSIQDTLAGAKGGKWFG